ncbi:hypothetical protein [Sphingomonas sp. CFBP 13720]|nr:hypothetical protein [Sphingomonas sp. CFBP 13720]MBD8679260.1 hypothetical protein [Sphingomonas sp. CFBP 13720]
MRKPLSMDQRDWLATSGEEARDYRRITFFPQVPEHEAVGEPFLLLK